MTVRHRIIFILIILLITVIVLFRVGLFRTSQIDLIQVFNRYIVGNSMNVKCSNDLIKEKIKINIAWSYKTVYEHEHFLDNIDDIYGGPIFDVYYDNVLIGRALHDNTNDWYTNEFEFNFFSLNNQIKFTFKTKGRDKNGEEGYIWIKKVNDTLYYESYEPNGKLINKWKE